jgi:hypothetical protein
MAKKLTQPRATNNKKSETQSKYGQAIITQSNPYGVREKPTKISFDLLRSIRKLSPIVAVCVKTLVHSVVKIPGHFEVKGDLNPEFYSKEIEYLENMVQYPNPQDNERTFWTKTLEDILVLDRGCIEFVRNGKGEIVQMWSVPGYTIKPRMDKHGIFSSPAYVQIMPGETKASAEFEEDEIEVLMDNPVNDLDTYGYGISPIEQIINAVVTLLNADTYNASVFTKNSIPAFLVKMGGWSPEQLDSFQRTWEEKASSNNFKGLFVSAEDIQYQRLKDSNQEMQYYELTLWLAKLVIAAFEMSPQDLGLTMDINRATGDTQREISKNQGIANLLDIRKEFYQKLIRYMAMVNPKFKDIEYFPAPMDMLDERTKAEIDKIYLDAGVKLVDEVRKELGLEDKDGEEPEEIEEFGSTEKRVKDKFKLWYSVDV